MKTFTENYFKKCQDLIDKINSADIETLAEKISKVRDQKGRIFFLGVGGSAANASHAVNDFRKICGIECYAPTDNVSELTARINDSGWNSSYAEWLKVSQLGPKDMVFVLSVGGGNEEKNVSMNLVEALKYGKKAGAVLCGVVGRDGGYTKKAADVCVVIPTVDSELVTPMTEAFQMVVSHLLVSHPKLLRNPMKWESVSK